MLLIFLFHYSPVLYAVSYRLKIAPFSDIQYTPDSPPTSIFLRFLASRMTTVSLPAVGTYLSEKQMSPSLFSCREEIHFHMNVNLQPTRVFFHCYIITSCTNLHIQTTKCNSLENCFSRKFSFHPSAYGKKIK